MGECQMTRWGHKVHKNIGTMVRCLVLQLLHSSLTDPTQSATHDQGKYWTSMSNRKLWSYRSLIFKELDVKNVLMWFMPLKSLTLIVWNFPGNPEAISRDFIPGKNAIFPGFPVPGKMPFSRDFPSREFPGSNPN